MNKNTLSGMTQTACYCLYGAMALIAFINAAMAYPILSGKYGLLFSFILIAIAALQLSSGNSFFSKKHLSLAWIVLIWFGIAQFGNWLRTTQPPSTVRDLDFSAYYLAGKAISQTPHANIYYLPIYPDGRMQFVGPGSASGEWQRFATRYDIPASVPFIYPPFSAALLQPLSYLPYSYATRFWSALNICLACAAVLITLKIGEIGLDAKLILLLMVGLFSYYPYRDELALGQIGSVILFLWASSVWLLSRNRNWSSALCFSLATMIKLTPVLAIPSLIIYRKWKWLIAYTCWTACLICFSLWKVGWGLQLQFIHSVMPSISCGAPVSQNLSIVSYVQQLFLGYVPDWITAPRTLPTMACFTSKLVALVLYMAILFQFYRYRRQQGYIHCMILMVFVSLVISPISWWHHYTLALLPFLYLWSINSPEIDNKILLFSTLAIGTNILGFSLLLTNSHIAQLILAGITPLSITLLIYRGISRIRVPLEIHQPLSE